MFRRCNNNTSPPCVGLRELSLCSGYSYSVFGQSRHQVVLMLDIIQMLVHLASNLDKSTMLLLLRAKLFPYSVSIKCLRINDKTIYYAEKVYLHTSIKRYGTCNYPTNRRRNICGESQRSSERLYSYYRKFGKTIISIEDQV